MESFINRCWYGQGPACLALRLVLAPLSLLFLVLVSLHSLAYGRGWKPSSRLPVPVLVVGNITAGGAGKTPLTLALVAWLREAGYRPGIVSRGYGGSAPQATSVGPDSDPRVVGDEPVLLARRAGCPVWVGRHRAEAGRGLLASHPEVDVVVADDGLQHYALARDLEIAVVDGQRGLGNGWLLPAGPLREPARRLDRVTAVVCNGGECGCLAPSVPVFGMGLGGNRFYNLVEPGRLAAAADLADGPVHALAGIGNPRRFFDHLARLGLTVVPHAFPDHHDYQAGDLPAGRLVMTEKDAVKVAPLARQLGLEDCWALAVDAELEPGLKRLMLTRLNQCRDRNHGPQAA